MSDPLNERQYQHLVAWKQHMQPYLDKACPICNALEITPTWSDPVIVEQQETGTKHSSTFQSGGYPKHHAVRLVCVQTGTVAHFDTAAVGLTEAQIAQQSREHWPTWPPTLP